MDSRRPPAAHEVREQLERILGSEQFAKSSRSQRFLRYLVEASLRDENEAVKEYAIALEVFDRDSSYDPAVDATVRVEAGRLRARLRDYYAEAGPADSVKITIPKGGYHATFAWLATKEEPKEEKAAEPEEFPRKRMTNWRLRALTALPLIVVVVIIAPAIMRRVLPGRSANASSLTGALKPFLVIQLTNLKGNVSWPAISPDGRQIAFVWDAAEHPSRGDLYVQFVDGEETPLRLTHTRSEYITPPTWSADGRKIAYGRCDDNGGAIYTVSALGGPEHRITDIACPYGYVPSFSWSSDEKSLVLPDRCVPDGSISIVVFSMETGTRRCLVSLPKGEEVGDGGPMLSPDQRTVAFVRVKDGGEWTGEIYTVPLAGGTPVQLTSDNASINAFMWTADGKYICFNSTRSGPERTWRVLSSGGPIQAETSYPGIGALSGDGTRLVYPGPSALSVSSVWRTELTSEGGSVIGKRQLLPDSSTHYSPRPSPDGRLIVFESERSGYDEIWRSNADGSDPRKLTSFNHQAGSPRWSADGKWIVFDYLGGKHRQIYAMDAEGRNLHLVVSGEYENGVPSWSRDGKTIFFTSDRTGKFQLWRHEMDSGRETQLTHDGGLASLESFDGKTLYFSKLSGGGIWAMPSGGGDARLVTDALHFGYWGEFAVTENGLYLVDSAVDPGPALMYYSFRTGRLKEMMNLNGEQKVVPWSANLGASRDGRIVLVVLGTFRSSLVMAENVR